MLGYRKYRQGESATEYHDSLGRIIMVSYRYGIVLYAVICCDGTLHFLAIIFSTQNAQMELGDLGELCKVLRFPAGSAADAF